MTVHTAAPNPRTASQIIHAILAWFKGADAPSPSEADHVDMIMPARDDLLKTGRKNLPGPARKLLENTIFDYSGV